MALIVAGTVFMTDVYYSDITILELEGKLQLKHAVPVVEDRLLDAQTHQVIGWILMALHVRGTPLGTIAPCMETTMLELEGKLQMKRVVYVEEGSAIMIKQVLQLKVRLRQILAKTLITSLL
jgi:hypothetical protein